MKQYFHTMKAWRRGFALTGYILLFCFIGQTGLYSWGQDLTPPPGSAPKVTTLPSVFAQDMQILSQRLKIAFVVEGQPLPVTKEQPTPSLDEKLSAEDAVREIADYFDYSSVRQGNVYLLTKRYTNQEDLPDVTPEECLFGLKTITRILDELNPKYPPPTLAGSPQANIARLLSAEQLDQLGKTGLPVSELTPSQHNEIWRLALKFYLQSQADHIAESDNILENRHPADPVFHWQTLMHIHAFGYDTRSVNLNDIIFIPVSDSNRIMVSPDGSTLERKSFTKINGVNVPDQDPTDPNKLSEATQQFLDDKDKSSHAISLSQAITALNKRAANQVVYKVDPMYYDKLVTLVGVDRLTPDVFMRALASVYGLRVDRNEHGDVILTHPLVLSTTQLSDLGRALRSAIPAPISRALRSRVLSEHSKAKDIDSPVGPDEYQKQGFLAYCSSLQVFRYLAEPTVSAQPLKKLPLSHLSVPARHTFALAYTVSAFSEACWLADRPLPPYISDMDHIKLTGGSYHTGEGAERFSLFFSYTDPKTGETHQGVGFTNAIVPP